MRTFIKNSLKKRANKRVLVFYVTGATVASRIAASRLASRLCSCAAFYVAQMVIYIAVMHFVCTHAHHQLA